MPGVLPPEPWQSHLSTHCPLHRSAPMVRAEADAEPGWSTLICCASTRPSARVIPVTVTGAPSTIGTAGRVVEALTITGMPEISHLPSDCLDSKPEKVIGAASRRPSKAEVSFSRSCSKSLSNRSRCSGLNTNISCTDSQVRLTGYSCCPGSVPDEALTKPVLVSTRAPTRPTVMASRGKIGISGRRRTGGFQLRHLGSLLQQAGPAAAANIHRDMKPARVACHQRSLEQRTELVRQLRIAPQGGLRRLAALQGVQAIFQGII